MNKTAIKNFAIWARRKLISDITYRAGMLGITENGILQPMKQSTKDLQFFDIGTKDYVKISGEEICQRNALLAAIKDKERSSDYKNAFQNIVEEVAYTWFHRLIAVRFMEVNDYLPSRIRVLSSENPNKLEPDFVTTPFDTDLDFNAYEKDVVYQLKEENKLDELFRMLFIKQCNKLSEILPSLFEQISDYTELLLTISFTDKDGVVYHLTHDISEDDFNVEKEGQVEIIGWLYQYYNTEPKDQVFANLKKNIKIRKEDIPAATQLFTPDWIVRYMVENSLGRLWVEGHPNDDLKATWKYYLEEAEQEPEVQVQLAEIRKEYAKLNPEDIRFIDPCMGSGHILVYAFDVFMQIYTSYGYTQRESAKSILVNNLYGIDIDTRAYQLSYFAVMMKARQYNRRIFNEGIMPNLMAVKNPAPCSPFCLRQLGELEKLGKRLITDFTDAEEYGSILNVSYKAEELDALEAKLAELQSKAETSNLLIQAEIQQCIQTITPLLRQARIMGQLYDVVVTNPPYMSAANMNSNLNEFIKRNYPDYKSDFFSAFVIKCTYYAKKTGYLSFLTPYVWMFIQSYEKMRAYLYQNCTIETLIQFEYSAFEEATVPICTFVFRNHFVSNKKGCYFRLTNFRGGMEIQRQKTLEAIANHSCGFYYEQSTGNFLKIPGSPVAYWVNERLLFAFSGKRIEDYAISNGQTKTGNNDKYLRNIWEVNRNFIGKGLKWVLHAKGGSFRRWYGNIDTVIDWSDTARHHYREDHVARIAPDYICFRKGVCWTLISSSKLHGFRLLDEYSTFNLAAPSIFFEDDSMLYYVIGYLNTKVCEEIISLLNPTLNTNISDITVQPLEYFGDDYTENIIEIVKDNISISKADWDAFETSWDFQQHPLIVNRGDYEDQMSLGFNSQTRRDSVTLISKRYEIWEWNCDDRFRHLKANEEELNRIFIDYYGLQDELTPEVEDKDVTVRKADLQRDIKSLISYAVGCMFGRYSLDVPGLAYAGGDWDSSKYKTYLPDKDNVIPITDEEYFKDDIVGRFVEFIRTAYGSATLEENLDFIANALDNSGKTARDTIRQYFLKDFFKDHCQTYSVTGSGKRPIYWLFDSGKQNGFKALVYMHRWNADTVGNMRVEYLHKMQTVYEKEIDNCQETIDNSMNSREIAAATKRKEKLVKQLKECKDYDAKVAHIALSRIDIDLDDGVKKNYRKVQTGADGRFCEILADSKNIMAKE